MDGHAVMMMVSMLDASRELMEDMTALMMTTTEDSAERTHGAT